MRDLRERTRKFALDVLRHCEDYPNKPAFVVITRQLMSAFWLEMLEELRGRKDVERTRLTDEAYQLVAIMVKSRKTARGDGA